MALNWVLWLCVNLKNRNKISSKENTFHETGFYIIIIIALSPKDHNAFHASNQEHQTPYSFLLSLCFISTGNTSFQKPWKALLLH